MKRRICVRSMGLGAIIMLIGLAVGAIVSPPLIAQRVIVAQNREFDDVQCKRLTVVDENGHEAIVLQAAKISNMITINAKGKDGRGAVIISASEQVGSAIAMFDRRGKAGLLIASTDEGNAIQILDRYKGKGGVFLDTTEDLDSSIRILNVAGRQQWEAP